MTENHAPDGDTSTASGSLTKRFVAVLIMRLRAEGLLDLADPVGKYLDPGEAGSVTIAQLLSHTAGPAAESRGPCWERTPGELRPSLGDIFGDRPQPLPAGRRFHYSNPGFALLGALAGHLRGHSWDEAVRREILSPLGMIRTTLRAQAPHAGGFAVHPWADMRQPEPAEHTGHMAPGPCCRRCRRVPGPGHVRLHAGTLRTWVSLRGPAARGRMADGLIADALSASTDSLGGHGHGNGGRSGKRVLNPC